MTKKELLQFLEPFDEWIEICVLSVDPSCVHTIGFAKYGMDGESEGLAVLHPNAPRIVLRRSESAREPQEAPEGWSQMYFLEP